MRAHAEAPVDLRDDVGEVVDRVDDEVRPGLGQEPLGLRHPLGQDLQRLRRLQLGLRKPHKVALKQGENV